MDRTTLELLASCVLLWMTLGAANGQECFGKASKWMWKKDETIRLTHVAVGSNGVWGLDATNQMFYKEGTYASPNSEGSVWIPIDGDLVQFDVGNGTVWGVDSSGEVFYRDGISTYMPYGTSWVHFDGNTPMNYISVSESGDLWAIDKDQHVFRWNAYGEAWEFMQLFLDTLSVDNTGVWGVRNKQEIYYRRGTFHKPGNEGWAWDHENMEFAHLSSTDNAVFAIDFENNVWGLCGVSGAYPTGKNWVSLKGPLQKIASYDRTSAWGIFQEEVFFMASK